MIFFFFKVLVWSYFNFVFGVVSVFIMELLIGLIMGNEIVILVIFIGNEIVLWKLKWKWDDVGL